jgi:uncharacterized membrane protein YdfJ with MMPL/SSD domain
MLCYIIKYKKYSILYKNPFRQESDKIKRTSRFRALNASIFIIAIPIMTLAMFVTYVSTGNTLTSEKVFTVIGIFMSARVVMTIFVPSSIMFLKEGGVSMKRIQVWCHPPVPLAFPAFSQIYSSH